MPVASSARRFGLPLGLGEALALLGDAFAAFAVAFGLRLGEASAKALAVNLKTRHSALVSLGWGDFMFPPTRGVRIHSVCYWLISPNT